MEPETPIEALNTESLVTQRFNFVVEFNFSYYGWFIKGRN